MYQILNETPDSPLIAALQRACFKPGQVVATPNALAAMEAEDCEPSVLLIRHLAGDWGEVSAEDAQANDRALQSGARLLSSYLIGAEVHIWLITEADRSATTFLLPSDY